MINISFITILSYFETANASLIEEPIQQHLQKLNSLLTIINTRRAQHGFGGMRIRALLDAGYGIRDDRTLTGGMQDNLIFLWERDLDRRDAG